MSKLKEKNCMLNGLIREKMPDASWFQTMKVTIDCFFNRAAYGTTIDDYFQYCFYEKNHYGRKKYTTIKKLNEFTGKVNDKQDRMIFRDKTQFAQKFTDYTGRNSIDVSKASVEDFSKFVGRSNRIFIKPTDSSGGQGARILECSAESVEKLYAELKDQRVIAEEVICQHPLMAEFNASSTNTIRIVTFIHKNSEIEILPGALLRLGRKGRIADNFHHHGIGAYIDEKTGVVITTGIDKSGEHYVDHPDSLKRIVGFQVPEWEKICATVKKAAQVVPTVRYVGWDVAITDKSEIILIEGNDKAIPDLAQISNRIGLWEKFKACLDE